jgi:predicted mannosyl-3-phosphoglycerate phosphatase (HAD superfamily)
MLRSTPVEKLAPIARPSMIVLADVSVLAEGHPPHRADRALTSLGAYDIPVVLASTRTARATFECQKALRLRHPFMSGGGAALHIPDGYFDAMLGLPPSTGDWHVINFELRPSASGFSEAIRLLLRLYWARRGDGLVVGVSDCHEELLELADVPIIVRNPRLDQRGMRKRVPNAYFTNATGCAGWAEGILGPLPE